MKKYARLFNYLTAYKSNIGLYFLFILLSIVFSVISLGTLPFFLKLIFVDDGTTVIKPEHISSSSDLINYLSYELQRISGNDKMYAVMLICVMVVITILLKNIFTYLSFYVLTPMRNGVIYHLREEVFQKILQMPIGYFTERRKGDIMSRLTNDISELEGSVVGTMEGLIKDPLTLLVYVGFLVFISPQLSMFLLILLPLTGFIIGRVSRSLKKQSHDSAVKQGESLSILEETLGGLRVIKAFTAEKIIATKFTNNSKELFRIKNKIQYRRDLASPLSEFLGVLVLCGILYLGGQLVLGDKGLTATSFILYIVIFTQIIPPAKALSTSFYNMQKGTAAIARIEEVLHAPVMVEAAEPKKVHSFEHAIEFKNVGFAYEDVVILKNINLKIEKGKSVALVGSSGAGKSTLADLVPRFHDVSSGELLIDGINIKEYSIEQLRGLMGIVTQDPILFNDTIENNIMLGIDNATPDAIEQAAKIANAHNFIIQKEQGYKTNIGDRGMKLSGGERQRMTIARAVLKNPPILILDEATSALDTESERLVQDAINKLMNNRTSIVIAHRLSTIRHADEIIVLQKGDIVERGTHDSLIAQNGFYKRLVDMQEVR